MLVFMFQSRPSNPPPPHVATADSTVARNPHDFRRQITPLRDPLKPHFRNQQSLQNLQLLGGFLFFSRKLFLYPNTQKYPLNFSWVSGKIKGGTKKNQNGDGSINTRIVKNRDRATIKVLQKHLKMNIFAHILILIMHYAV